ncbi:unknown [Fusobacterium sp. CAG:439]|nr:unknown [Fusobacterium sp. CAG:439]
MNEKITKILKIAAYTGLIAASVFSVVKGLKEKNKHDKKEKMLLIAKQLNSDIRNTERKTSPRYHEKNQEKYDELWGDESACN